MKAILCCDANGGIGKHGKMPWEINHKDLRRFKSLTQNTTVVMGSGTWDSSDMPKPLPNRTNIVVSNRNLSVPDGVIVCTSDDLHQYDIDWCIGGAKLFHYLFDHIDEIHLSVMHNSYDCDTMINLEAIRNNFIRERSQLCLTHTYEIWTRIHYANIS